MDMVVGLMCVWGFRDTTWFCVEMFNPRRIAQLVLLLVLLLLLLLLWSFSLHLQMIHKKGKGGLLFLVKFFFLVFWFF